MKKLILLTVFLVGCRKANLKVTPSKTTLIANGYDHMVFRIEGITRQPTVEILGDKLYSRLRTPQNTGDHWRVELDAGVMPGPLKVRIRAGRQHITQTLTLLAQATDSASDGTPDFLRLDDNADRESFRFWITYIGELQYFISPSARPPEIADCSSLIRFAYHEALRDHNAAWIASAKLPIAPAHSSVKKYAFPHTILGPNLFRTRSGTYTPADLTDGAFAEFADAKTLQKFNTYFVSRDITQAQPGDILFYRRETTKGVSYHSMIFIGPSKVKPDGEIYVVYHTGPDGTNNGEIRRLTLTQLLHFPNQQWHPIAANELFLGVYRWNILKVIS